MRAPGRDMSYIARIRKVATGEERDCQLDIPWYNAGGSSWWWSEGNYGCDCNRCLEFERAGGNELIGEVGDYEDAPCPCGHGGYLIVSITLPDGRVVYSEVTE